MNDYNIFNKILIVFTTIKHPYIILFDKLGLGNNFLYITYSGIKFIARAKSSDINEGIAILSGKEYPRDILNIISKKNPAIVDAGAHIGLFSLYVKSVNPHSRIFAIEPMERNIDSFKKNLILNNFKSVKILKFALSDKKGFAKLWVSDNAFDQSTISETRIRVKSDYEMVATATFSDVLKQHNIKRVNVLKMDIEGVEYKVIKKDIKIIAKKVERLLVEYHTDSDKSVRKKIINILTKNNFKHIFENRHILGFSNNSLE